MGYFSFLLSNEQLVQVHTMPASPVMRVTFDEWMPDDTARYDPSMRCWKNPAHERTIQKRMGVRVMAELKDKLASLDAARRSWCVASEPSNPRPADSRDEFVQAVDSLRRALANAVEMTQHSKFDEQLSKAIAGKLLNLRESENVRRYNQARNVQQHTDGGIQIVVRDYAVLEEIQHLTNKLSKDRLVSELMIPRKKILAARWDDHVRPAAETMLSRQYSHVPILDEDDRLQGIFSADTLLFSTIRDELSCLDSQTKFESFRAGAEHVAGKTETEHVLFLSPKVTLHDAHRRYRDHIRNGNRVSVGFVTENGIHSEPIKGLITIWDFPSKY